MVTGASAPLTVVAGLQDNLSGPLKGIQGSTKQLEKHFTKLSGAVQNAFQFYVRYRIFGLINRGISAVENAIPGLIARGHEWANTVDDISDSSGLAAERSSLLAGVVLSMTGSVDGLTKALGALAANAVNHGDVMQRYGIKTKDANGNLLDTWTILKNVRQALSETGNGFITTAAAREMFSRGGQTLIDFLTMTDKQLRMVTKDARESGVVMTQAGLDAAETWTRTRQRFDMSLTGLGTQIMQGVQQPLTRLVDAFTNYIRANLAQIVGFVTQVVTFAANAVAGFLGLDLGEAFYETVGKIGKGQDKVNRGVNDQAKSRTAATDSEDGYSKAINRQVEAIDAQIEALDRREKAEDARREQAQLLRDISDARRELEEIRSKSIFAAGMSYAEAELARQAQTADIVDAQEKLGEAQKKLREQQRDDAREDLRQQLQDRRDALQQRLADHMAMLAKESAASREAMNQIFDPKGGAGSFPKGVEEAVKNALKEGLGGKAFGQELRVHLDNLIKTLGDTWDGLQTAMPIWQSTLQTIGDTLSTAASVLQDIADGISNWNPFGPGEGKINLGIEPGNLALAGVAAYLNRGLIGKLLGMGGRALLPGVGTAAAGAATGAASAVGGSGIAAAVGGAMAALGTAATVAGVAAIASAALKTISGGVGPEETLRRLGMRDTPANRKLTQLTGAGDAFGLYKTGQDSVAAGLEAVFGGLKLHELWEGQTAANDAVATAVGEGGPIATQQKAIATALGEDGALAVNAATTATALAPTGDVPTLLREVSTYTQRMANRAVWGVANMNVYLDKELVLELAGVPIRPNNSSLRAERNR
jgi:hypothetical protein